MVRDFIQGLVPDRKVRRDVDVHVFLVKDLDMARIFEAVDLADDVLALPFSICDQARQAFPGFQQVSHDSLHSVAVGGCLDLVRRQARSRQKRGFILQLVDEVNVMLFPQFELADAR